jgi:hypothetical protein
MIIAGSYTTLMMAARGSSEPETIQCSLKLSCACNCCKSLQQLEKIDEVAEKSPQQQLKVTQQ